MSKMKLSKAKKTLLLALFVITPTTVISGPNDDYNKNGGYFPGSEDSIIFNGVSNYKRKINGYIALNPSYNVGGNAGGDCGASYSFQGQYQGQSQAACGAAEEADKNGGAESWKREIFYCLSTDFLALTFGNYSNGRVSFNSDQTLECEAGKTAFLNSDGELTCEIPPQTNAQPTSQPILYIHAKKILAVKAECTSPKGQVSDALTLFERRSIYVKGSAPAAQQQYQSQYQYQGQYQGQNIVLQ